MNIHFVVTLDLEVISSLFNRDLVFWAAHHKAHCWFRLWQGITGVFRHLKLSNDVCQEHEDLSLGKTHAQTLSPPDQIRDQALIFDKVALLIQEALWSEL